ncbi:MAG: T9SS type A sorting domain-containing protein, partial [Draconibacterium sp.]|nr:T9SS type A sorting domain-containing protein [Draconibacterium sp.]
SIPLGSTEHYWVDASEVQLQHLTVYDWDVSSKLDMVSSHYYQQDVYAEGVTLGHGSIYFISTNVCGSNQSSLPVMVTNMLLLAITPNPTNNETTLSIETTSEDIEFDENAEWDLKIYSQTQELKTKVNKLKGKEYKIQTQGWREGIYFVRVKYKNEVLQGKLVVKK